MSDRSKAKECEERIKINQIPDTPVTRILHFKVLITDDDRTASQLGTHRVHIFLSTEIVTNGNSWGLGTHRVHITISTEIYTTKIGTFVCPPHISETVAVRTMKRAHHSRIASTTKKIISKQILLSILSILF